MNNASGAKAALRSADLQRQKDDPAYAAERAAGGAESIAGTLLFLAIVGWIVGIIWLFDREAKQREESRQKARWEIREARKAR